MNQFKKMLDLDLFNDKEKNKISNVEGEDYCTEVYNGLYKNSNGYYVNFQRKNWFQEKIGYYKIKINPKYSRKGINISELTIDVAPKDYPHDFYIFDPKDLIRFLFENTYYYDKDRPIIMNRYMQLSLKLRYTLKSLLNSCDEYPTFDMKETRFVMFEEKSFANILSEVVSDKPFNTLTELFTAIKKSLNAERNLTKDEEDKIIKRFGYTLKTHKNEFRIKMFGDGVHSLLEKFKLNKIQCRYISISNTIVIRYDENVNKDGLLSDKAKEELESGSYNVIGTKTNNEHDLNFNPVQLAIYKELMKFNLVKWDTQKNKSVLIKIT